MTSIAFPYNPPSSPFLRVTYRQKPNLKWQNLSLQNPEDPYIYLSSTKQRILLLVEVCKLFSYSSKPIHALLVSKRRPFSLQKIPV